MRSKSSGFTLIELLVVISIISLLSSVVFASLNSGRLKAKDAAIKASGEQLRILLEQNYNEYGTYRNMQTQQWYSTAADCSAPPPSGGIPPANYPGKFQTQFVAICTNIITNSAASTSFGGSTNGGRLYMGNNDSVDDYYSVMAYLPYKTTFFCIGSSGATSDTTTPANVWGQPGCHTNH